MDDSMEIDQVAPLLPGEYPVIHGEITITNYGRVQQGSFFCIMRPRYLLSNDVINQLSSDILFSISLIDSYNTKKSAEDDAVMVKKYNEAQNEVCLLTRNNAELTLAAANADRFAGDVLVRYIRTIER